MTPSKYQLAIYDAVANTQDNLGIDAVAGSGKSTVLQGILERTSSGSKNLVAAFNKRIADAFRKRVPIESQTEVSTINSFGWGVCRKALGEIKLDAFKTDNILQSYVDKSQYYKWRNSVSRLVGLGKCLDMNESTFNPQELGTEYGIDVPAKLDYNIVHEVYFKSLALREIMDYDDQVFMPSYLGLEIPQYDLALIDESQDLNKSQQSLLWQCAKRTIVVGDTHQAIYRFRGADSAALANMIAKINATVLPLSICYRCPKAQIELAKTVVPYIEARDDAPDGIVAEVDDLSTAVEGDAVLCRTTAPLVQQCFNLIRQGKKAIVLGKDIGKQLTGLISAVSDGPWTKIEQFHIKLQDYKMAACDRLKDMALQSVLDRIETIEVLCEGSKTVKDVNERIAKIFSDDQIGIVFCTIHKSKGSEWNRVFILKRDQMPHPKAKLPEDIEQEKNLYYVAVTRSMSELYWVKG